MMCHRNSGLKYVLPKEKLTGYLIQGINLAEPNVSSLSSEIGGSVDLSSAVFA